MILWEGADPRTSGRLYVALVQYLLLFGSETWVVMSHIFRAMWSLHNRGPRQISGRMPQRLENLGWDYPLIGEALEDAGLETIGIHINLRHNTVDKYISACTVFNIVVAQDQRPDLPELLM